MKKKVKFALIGCGRVAGHHARSINELPEAQLVAVCDLKEDRAKAYGQEFNVPYYLNYNEMLKNHDADVVNIITPSGMHPTHAVDIIEKYKKHVVIEKPMFMDMKDKERLLGAAKRNKVKIFPVYQNRYNKAVKKVKEAVDGNIFGKVAFGEVRLLWSRPQRYYDMDPWRGKWALDGGAFTNQGIHYLDLLRCFMGEVEEVSAVSATRLVSAEVEDTGAAWIRFKSGAVASVIVTTAARPKDIEALVSVFGENGRAIIGGIAANELKEWTLDNISLGDYSEIFPTVYGFGHKAFLNDVIKDLNGEAPHPVTFEEGAKTVELLNAVYAAVEGHGIVRMENKPASKNLGRYDKKLYDLYTTK